MWKSTKEQVGGVGSRGLWPCAVHKTRAVEGTGEGHKKVQTDGLLLDMSGCSERRPTELSRRTVEVYDHVPTAGSQNTCCRKDRRGAVMVQIHGLMPDSELGRRTIQRARRFFTLYAEPCRQRRAAPSGSEYISCTITH
jgi:hypothetical protein